MLMLFNVGVIHNPGMVTRSRFLLFISVECMMLCIIPLPECLRCNGPEQDG